MGTENETGNVGEARAGAHGAADRGLHEAGGAPEGRQREHEEAQGHHGCVQPLSSVELMGLSSGTSRVQADCIDFVLESPLLCPLQKCAANSLAAEI